MAVLNLVMCRRDEPIELFYNFLQMLLQQRNINEKSIEVTFMQLGNDHSAEDHIQVTKEFNIDYVHIHHDSIAKAYNQCIMRTDAPWIMFMDYGDMFPDVYSLSMILNLLPTDEWDITWLSRYEEYTPVKGSPWVNIVNDTDESIYGKLFRTKFLLDNKLFSMRH